MGVNCIWRFLFSQIMQSQAVQVIKRSIQYNNGRNIISVPVISHIDFPYRKQYTTQVWNWIFEFVMKYLVEYIKC